MEVIYEHISDIPANAKIQKLNLTLKTGKGSKSTPPDIKWELNKLILPILKDLGINNPKKYSDAFESVELCRMKYEIESIIDNLTAEIIGTQLYNQLKDELNIKSITIGIKEGRTLIIIWI